MPAFISDTDVMLQPANVKRRPIRWDMPLGEMAVNDVQRILRTSPFAEMDRSRFPAYCQLDDIIRNDTRIVRFTDGQPVVRRGEYGQSAFLILAGKVNVVLDERPRDKRPGDESTERQPLESANTPVFVQDHPGVATDARSLQLTAGAVFGELAALNRSIRTASVIAASETELLEIRWQGLRDLMEHDRGLREYVYQLYRENALASHLRQTRFLSELPAGDEQAVIQSARFKSFGNMQWTHELMTCTGAEAIEREPIIAEEGEAVDSLMLIRAGFCRISVRHGNGHRTFSYIGKGQQFGLEELFQDWSSGVSSHYQRSLRAVGYVDVINIPKEVIFQHLFERMSERPRDELANDTRRLMRSVISESAEDQRGDLPAPLLEFLVDQRFINATSALLIDLDRCTRCDDCVVACAETHDGLSRFVREGPVHQHLMVASACMHCVDPVCMIGCPTGAIHRKPMSGTVSISESTCIGCGMCAQNCPYSVIRMSVRKDGRGRPIWDEVAGQPLYHATKCDLCESRRGGPACQQACSWGALRRIDLQTSVDLRSWIGHSTGSSSK